MEAFARISAGEDPTDRMPEEVAELERLGFVVRDLRGSNPPVTLDPFKVIRKHAADALQNAAACIAAVQAMPKTADVLADAYRRSQWHAAGRSEFIPDPKVVNARLQHVVGSAQTEILAAQPSGPRAPEHLKGASERDIGALDRGVAMRTLYHGTVRDHTVTAEHARAMSSRPHGKSAEFRTLDEPFERCIVVDRRVAFISNTIVPSAHEHAAWQITDEAFVAYVLSEFEARWRRSVPWHGELRDRAAEADVLGDREGVRTTRRQREILRDLATSRPQPRIAARLGISLRKLGVEIADLKSLFDAETLQELTYKWATSPDHRVDDSAPEAGPSGADSGRVA